MKRPIVIELIQEFILSKPKRPYEEVEAYARQLNASYEELQDAILNASARISQKLQKKHPFMRVIVSVSQIFTLHSLTPIITPIKLGVVFATISITLFVFYLVNFHNDTIIPNTVLTTYTSDMDQDNYSGSSDGGIKIRSVYANEERMDASQIFSISPEEITLKFKGIPNKEVFGFFPYWMLDVADKVNLDNYTSVSLFGLEIDGQGNIVTVSQDGTMDGGWSMWQDKRLRTLLTQTKRKRIKVYLTLKSFNNKNIEELVASDEAQKRAIANTIQLVNSKSLDGINIDFEYIGKASKETMLGFTRFMANMNIELKRQIPHAELSIDTYLSSAAANDFFDVQLLQEHLDMFIVMGYDVHTPFSEAGSVAPMEGPNGILGYMQSFLERVPPEKLVLAVPQYGYDWPITGRKNEETGDSITKGKAAILSYAVIANQSKKYKIFWNETTKTPYYKYVDNDGTAHEVHFENTRSLGIKYDFVNDKKLKGVGVWAIGYEGLSQEMQQLILEKFAQ